MNQRHSPPELPAPEPLADARQAIWRLRRRLVALAILIAGVVIAGSAWLLLRERAEAVNGTGREVLGLTHALEEHVARTLGEIDNTLLLVGEAIDARGGLATVPRDGLARVVRIAAPRLLQASALLVAANNGEVLAWSQDRPIAELKLPAGFLVPPAETSLDAILIGPVVPGATGRGDAIPVRRYLRDEDARVVGVVAALLDTKYFTDFYRELQLPRGSTVLLMGEDRRLLLAYPGGAGKLEAELAEAPFFTELANEKEGRFLRKSPQDGVERLFAFQRLLNYPLLVAIHIPRDTLLAGWQRELRRVVLVDVVVLALMAAVLVLLYRDARQHVRSRTQLEALNALLEQRVNDRTAELQRNSRELVELSYAISHDLRAPLRAISGFASVVEEDEAPRLSRFGRDALERVRRASARMEGLIDDLLALLELSRAPLARVEFDLAATLREVFARQPHGAGGLELKLSIAEPLTCRADPELVRRLLDHLLKLARRMCDPHRPRVSVQPLEHSNGFRMRFRLGVVLAPGDRLFEPFQLFTGPRGQDSTGIGLALARRICERHHGWIKAEVEEGRDDGREIRFEIWFGPTGSARTRRGAAALPTNV